MYLVITKHTLAKPFLSAMTLAVPIALWHSSRTLVRGFLNFVINWVWERHYHFAITNWVWELTGVEDLYIIPFAFWVLSYLDEKRKFYNQNKHAGFCVIKG